MDDIIIAFIGAAGVVGAAIVAGMRSQNKETRVLQKIEILGKRIELVEKAKNDTQQNEKTVDRVLADRLNDSINRDIFEISGSEKRIVSSLVVAFLLIAFGICVLCQVITTTDNVSKVVFLAASMTLIGLGAVALYFDMIPSMIDSWVRIYYSKFLEQKGVVSNKKESVENLDKLKGKIKRSIKRSGAFTADEDTDAATEAAIKAIEAIKNPVK